jgi:membrane peptidoglycan carboxypeptidase
VSSVNAVAAHTLQRVGLEKSYDFATDELGITTLTTQLETSSGVMTDVGYAPLALGALTRGMTVREVANAYATFANQGVWRQGRTFLLVLDDEGDVVLQPSQDSRKVFGRKTVNYMNYCLDSAVAFGTGTAADLSSELGMDVAGKTGTTASSRDRYFAGFTGYYTAAVWCGYDNPEEIVLTDNKSNPAARLWKKVMLQLHKGLPTIPLYSTKDMELVPICMDTGKLATDSCYHDIRTADGLNRVEKVWLYPQDKPHSYCNKHISLDYCLEGHGVANEYCKKFAQIGALKLETKAFLKLTQSQIQGMLQARGKGLDGNYLRDDYIYLVDKNGHDASYHGISGKINQGLNVPYEVCRIHTKQSWEDYQRPPATTTPTKPPTSSTEPIPPTTGETNPTTLPTEPTVEETTPPTETMPPTESTPATRPTEPEQTTDIETVR